MNVSLCARHNVSCCRFSKPTISQTFPKRFIKKNLKNVKFTIPTSKPKAKTINPFAEIRKDEKKPKEANSHKIRNLEQIVKHAEEVQKEALETAAKISSSLAGGSMKGYNDHVTRMQTNAALKRKMPTFDAEEAARLIPLNKYGEIDLTPEKLDIKFGKFLFGQTPKTLLQKVHELDRLPEIKLPEIAFAGRSNVGKSSLMNTLMNTKLVATSSTPGKTQSLDFFEIGTKPSNFFLVDMPGYGYHKAPKEVSDKWPLLVNSYIESRGSRLKRVVLLIDSRHGFMQSDLDFMKFLDKVPISYQIVLTKSDKITEKQLDQVVPKMYDQMRKRTACFHHIGITSSLNSNGIEDLRAHLASATQIPKTVMGKHLVPTEQRVEEITQADMLKAINTGKRIR